MQHSNVKDLKSARGLLVVSCSKKNKTKVLKTVSQFLQLNLDKELKDRKFEGKPGKSILLDTPGQKFVKAVLIKIWKEKLDDEFLTSSQFRQFGANCANEALRSKQSVISLYCGEAIFKVENQALAFLEGLILSQYKFKKYKSHARKQPALKLLSLGSTSAIKPETVRRVKILCAATELARDLVNTPAVDCNPRSLAAQCRSLARKSRLKCEVLDQRKLRALKANALLAVGKASEFPPCLVKLTYKPRRKARAVLALAGKGVTYDSGGICIKSYPGIQMMKDDMAGAAAVIGAMQAIAQLKPDIEVRAYLPLAENMISSNAMRTGDVVKAVNGKTIEVLNTDAEGRLILADAISLACREKPDYLIDLATLTGAAVVALGPEYAALFTDDEKLSKEIIKAGNVCGERYWPMPLAPEYENQLESAIADLRNIGGGYGGSITAALFLKRFVSNTRWAHLDIAGPAFADGSKEHISRGGVGFGVRMLAELSSRLKR